MSFVPARAVKRKERQILDISSAILIYSPLAVAQMCFVSEAMLISQSIDDLQRGLDSAAGVLNGQPRQGSQNCSLGDLAVCLHKLLSPSPATVSFLLVETVFASLLSLL